MTEHMQDAAQSVKKLKGRLQGRLILDAESQLRPAAPARAEGAQPARSRRR